MPYCLIFCFTGTNNLQITVTPTPESFPHGKLLPLSPTWPFSEVQSSSAVARIKNVLGSSPDNTSMLQFARTLPPKTRRRTRAPRDFSSSPYQASGHGASLEPSKDSTESLVQPRPQGGKEAAAMSGLPPTSMLPPLSTDPSVTSLSAVLPSQPVRAGTPSISKPHSLRSDILPFLPPSSPSSLAPDSPHSSTFSKPAQRPTKVPLSSQTAPTDSSSSQSVTSPLNPFADEMNHTPPTNEQDLIGIPHLGFSGSSTKQYSELFSVDGPGTAGSTTSEFLSSVEEPVHLSPEPLALGSLRQLPDGVPSWSLLGAASSPASTQPVKAEVAERVHNGVSLLTFRNPVAATTYEAVSSPFKSTVAMATTSRKPAPATANESANPLHLSAAPENYEGPTLSAEHTVVPSSWVPSLPPTTASQGQAILSGVAPASLLNSAAAYLPSRPTFLQLVWTRASPSALPKMTAPQEEGNDRSPPTAATDFLLSSKLPNLLSTIWTFPLRKEDSVTAVLKKNEKANLTAALQTLPSKESPNLYTVNGFTSDFSTDHISPTVTTTPRTSLLPSELPLPSIPSVKTTQNISPSPSFSNTQPGTYAAALDHSELPVSAPKQVTALPSSSEVYDFLTMGDVKKPEITDVFWSSFSAETGSLSTEPTVSGLLQQTNYDLNGNTINSTSWETHSASPTPPSGLTLAASVIKSQDFKDTAGNLVTTEGFSIQGPVLSTSTNQAIQQSDATMVGNHTAFLAISSKNHPKDSQTAEVEDHPTTGQLAVSLPHLQLSAHPVHLLLLTSPTPTATASLPDMLSDGMDTHFQIPSDINLSPVVHASTLFQSSWSYPSTTESPPLLTSAFFRTPPRVLLASQRPGKWTGAASTAGSLPPGTQKTGMTASLAKASSSSADTQLCSEAADTLSGR